MSYLNSSWTCETTFNFTTRNSKIQNRFIDRCWDVISENEVELLTNVLPWTPFASSTRVQGKTLVSNSTPFSDITSKCILSTVPVTNTSCNINFNKKSYSLSCSDTTSKNPSSYSKAFAKPFAKDMKYSYFKIEKLLPLKDGILSDGPDSSYIYKSKYDVATYRGQAPILWWKSKFNQKCVCAWKKTFAFQKQLDLLNVSGYCCFSGFVILPVRKHLTACLVLCLVTISLQKLLVLKIYFHSPSGQVLFLTLELIVKAKRRKLILHMKLSKAFIFQYDLNLKLFFLKSKTQVMKLMCFVIENISKESEKSENKMHGKDQKKVFIIGDSMIKNTTGTGIARENII